MQDGKGTSRKEMEEIMTEIKVFCCLDLDFWEVGRWLLRNVQGWTSKAAQRACTSCVQSKESRAFERLCFLLGVKAARPEQGSVVFCLSCGLSISEAATDDW